MLYTRPFFAQSFKASASSCISSLPSLASTGASSAASVGTGTSAVDRFPLRLNISSNSKTGKLSVFVELGR